MIMAVMMPQQNWTDERLDHFETRVEERFDLFESKVDERFERVDERFERVEERFERVDERFKEVNKRFGEVDKRLERIETNIGEMHGAMLGVQRIMLQGFIAICTAMVSGFAVLAGIVG
jgi:archaellum component FlaC